MDEQFAKGLRQARNVVRKAPGAVAYWLARARKSRRRPRTWLFDWKKRRFLSGFIAGLETHRADHGRPADATDHAEGQDEGDLTAAPPSDEP